MQSGADAFRSLVRAINGESAEERFSDPPFERLRRALDLEKGTPLELAILLRHALRYEELRRNGEIEIASNRFEPAMLHRVGITPRSTGNTWRLSAAPWAPHWLPDSRYQATDKGAMRASRKRFTKGESVQGDPFLHEFGLEGYRSGGQRSAVRSALSMPPGSSLVVDLPTGEGKSLVFQTIDRFGFATDAHSVSSQLTLVIVPTVTLAQDHERSCGGSDDQPQAYIGGETDRNARIRKQIRNGDQGLLFVSPEAVVGPLRKILGTAVEQGRLRAVVIDEAHLVESWGTGFRTEFQTFAGLCHQWKTKESGEIRFRTIFLSATFSDIARTTLEELFSPDKPLKVVSAAALRPEPEFWVAGSVASEEREERVMEALLHLPRPAILYVTEVQDAESWYRRLSIDEGMTRVRLVHGRTKPQDRRSVLRQWADGDLDLVVATSAFGLGVDYPHVRTIIHACVPEKLDRFYQEVGRAGRDGCTSISLLLPAFDDWQVARSLANHKVITVKRGLERWTAMFQHPSRIPQGDLAYSVRLNVAPSNAPEDIDLVGERSIDWNMRTLSLMARSGLIQLLGVPDIETPEGEEAPPYLTVKILQDTHLDSHLWERFVEPKRREIRAGNEASFKLLRDFSDNKHCPATLIAQIYPGSAHRCTSCRRCRIDPSEQRGDALVREPHSPWPISPGISDGLRSLVGSMNRALIEYTPSIPSRMRSRDLRVTIDHLDHLGFRMAIFIGKVPDWITDTIKEAIRSRPWLLIQDSSWRRPVWPKGNALIFSGQDIPLSSHQLRNSRPVFAELIFVPEGQVDADNPERRIRDLLQYPPLSLLRFIAAVIK